MSDHNNHSSIISLYESQHNEKDRVNSHDHQTHQILYALEGHGTCTLDNKTFGIERDSFIIIPPFTEHSITAQSKMTVLVLEFDACELSEDVQSQLIPEVFQRSVVKKVSMFDSSDLRQLLRKMLYEQSHGDRLWQLALKVYMSELLFTIARAAHDFTQADTNSLRAERLRNYIDSRYFEIKNAEDIADRMGMSKRYIQSIFKEQYELTPMQYLTEVRLGLVKRLLVETEKDIVSICFEAGFESLSTFYRLFKKQVGVPPNMYRQRQKSV
ncbi:AraC family transcriptional regulator [Halobacillus salinarum]|uniref:AraC family transcriptional regulator n=1 Tax=Halobacillus salinarum TaxID=2932257 RepID=A0ABY4EJ47_9BACI|nr:AraC family transcriptional regulator [Halobacillus salinarum]UOQ44116.1 AraC family transcriptional regulator [Halobacillus salinarum]